MAIAVASSSVTTPAGGTSVVITAPSGILVNDLLIAHIGEGDTAGNIQLVNTPSGWTKIRQDNITGSGQESAGALFYKVAISADVSASNYTFRMPDSGSGNNQIGGGIIRVTGANIISIPNAQNSANITGGFTRTFADPITPSKANSLLLFFISTSGVSAPNSYSGYAIVNNNPSWTELYDNQAGSGVAAWVAAAWGLYTPTTTTGNSSAVKTANTGQDVGQLIALSPGVLTSVSDTQTTNDSTLTFRTRVVSVTDTQSTIDAILVAFGSRWSKITKSVSTWIDTTRHQ